MGFFARIDAWETAICLAAAMLAAWGVGHWKGSRIRARGETFVSGKFEDGSVALLGLLLAFTFAMSLGKHDERRRAVVSDSNAIGDFYTCASLLPDEIRAPLQALLRDYTAHRLEVAKRPLRDRSLEESLRQSMQMEGAMTDLVRKAVNGGTPVTVPLVNTLNEVTSSRAARLAAVKDRLPTSILLLLMLAAAASTGLTGMQQGAAGKMQLTGPLSFILLVTLVAYVTLDLNQPVRGLITVSQEPMKRLLSSMTP